MSNYRIKRFSFLLFLFVFIGLASTSFASEPLRQVYIAGEPINISVAGRYIGNADFEHDAGSYSVAEYAAAIEWHGFSFTYTGRQYSWDDLNKLKFGNGNDDPWGSLHNLSLGYNKRGSINDKWGWFAGITGQSSFEEEMDKSFSAFGQAGFTYRFNDDWSTFFGVVGTVSNDDPMVYPFVGVNYRDPKALGLSASIGFPASYAGYRFNEVIAMRLGATMTGSSYRLADDSPVAKEGYLSEQDLTTGLYVDITPKLFEAGEFAISLGLEYTTLREMEIYDKDYNKMMDIDVDDAFGGFIRLQYTF